MNITQTPAPERPRPGRTARVVAPAPHAAAAAGADSGPGPAPAIALTGLHKSFGAVSAVRGIDLTVPAGEVVAFLGPNGAGKSTTIDLLLGLTEPDQGSARLFGGSPHAAVRGGRVGAMLQAGALLPDITVRELITTFAALHRDPMSPAEAMARAGVADIARQQTTKLSGGQVQRVRFALALIPDPDLLVLDEPTVAMDVEVRRAFWASMREFVAGGRTVLFATHYLEEADEFADRIVVVARGQVVADGSAAAIKNRVGGRTILATVADRPAATPDGWPGVEGAQWSGSRLTLRCSDSDAALRALLAAAPTAHDIEVKAADLEDAFLALVADPAGSVAAG